MTIDHQSLEDRTVTLRDRDSLEQIRIAIDDLGDGDRASASRAVDIAEVGGLGGARYGDVGAGRP